ncbi:hypothetical protein ABT56_18580 [Photobacterium aquae]|uniref:Uncharacterized protein n=1 Tax=Photobacterium aquae TaxID=1195763 RepID=A0A0J1GVY8_9GAMM|nr:hypothetical protein [Photobacterium aquae]KLV03604.1 hypothetical protein ABT56_18580 [Photobacterium aquae]
MRHIDDFIDQLENGENPFNIWVYSSKGQYSQFGTQGKKIRTPGLQKALRKHLQIVVEVVNDAEQEAYLLLPEVHAAVPVSFANGQVQQLTRPTH